MAPINPDAVVCAVNAWTNHVLSLVGFRIPYKNFVHERFVTVPFQSPPRLPAVNDHILNGYVRPTDDDRLLVGTSVDVAAYEMRGPNFDVSELEPHPDALPFIEGNLVNRTALLEGVEWDHHTVGLISLAQRCEASDWASTRHQWPLRRSTLPLRRFRLQPGLWVATRRECRGGRN